MEQFTLQNVLWLLVGSIGTIVITKLFEIFQSSRANKFELKKIYFERKISAAEEAIEYLQKEIDNTESIIRVYEKIPQSDISLLPRLTKEINNITEDAIEKEKTSKRISDSMYLYFDFEDYNINSHSNHINLLELSLAIYNIDFDMEIRAKILQESQDPAMRDIIYDDIKKRFPEYFPKLEELVKLGRKAVEEAKNQQKKIISEMKKYDL
jgi:hypothetical protein